MTGETETGHARTGTSVGAWREMTGFAAMVRTRPFGVVVALPSGR